MLHRSLTRTRAATASAAATPPSELLLEVSRIIAAQPHPTRRRTDGGSLMAWPEVGGLLAVSQEFACDDSFVERLAVHEYEGALVRGRRSRGATRLHHAALVGDVERVRTLLAVEHVCVDAMAQHRLFARASNTTPLALAVIQGHRDVARELLQHGASSELANSGLETAHVWVDAAHLAKGSKSGKAIVRLICKLRGEDGMEAIDALVLGINCRIPCVIKLFGAEVKTELSDKQSFYDCCGNWLCQELLDIGGNYMYCDPQRDVPPAHLASARAYLTVLDSPYIEDALDVFGSLSDVKSLHTLLRETSPKRVEENRDAFLWATAAAGDMGLVKRFFTADSILYKDEMPWHVGRPTVVFAAMRGHADIVHFLINRQTAEQQSREDELNILAAVHLRDCALAHSILERHNFDIDLPPMQEEELTALTVACEQADLDMVQQLLGDGADVNATVRFWRRDLGASSFVTALWFAVNIPPQHPPQVIAGVKDDSAPPVIVNVAHRVAVVRLLRMHGASPIMDGAAPDAAALIASSPVYIRALVEGANDKLVGDSEDEGSSDEDGDA